MRYVCKKILFSLKLFASSCEFFSKFCFLAIREDGMPGGRNKSIGPVKVTNDFTS